MMIIYVTFISIDFFTCTILYTCVSFTNQKHIIAQKYYTCLNFYTYFFYMPKSHSNSTIGDRVSKYF